MRLCYKPNLTGMNEGINFLYQYKTCVDQSNPSPFNMSWIDYKLVISGYRANVTTHCRLLV